MKQSVDMMGTDPPDLVGQAEFTLDMIRNLLVVSEATAQGRTILVELRVRGVWAVTPDGQRLYVGHVGNADPSDM